MDFKKPTITVNCSIGIELFFFTLNEVIFNGSSYKSYTSVCQCPLILASVNNAVFIKDCLKIVVWWIL